MIEDKQPVLIVFSDGSVLVPGATTYGELLERFEFAAHLARDAERKMRATPLPEAPKE